MNARRHARSAAALALAAGSLAVPVTAASVLTAAPAAAATCGGGPGVTVVVDRASLGGGASSGCDGDGGTATDNFADTGVALTYAQREPGFVCRVNGVPQNDPCQNASPRDAYWGLWWSDGRSGRWRYSSVGVGSLSVPAGGSVAFRFSTGDSTPPAVAPPVRASGQRFRRLRRCRRLRRLRAAPAVSPGRLRLRLGQRWRSDDAAPTTSPLPTASTPSPSARRALTDGRGSDATGRGTASDGDRAGARGPPRSVAIAPTRRDSADRDRRRADGRTVRADSAP